MSISPFKEFRTTYIALFSGKAGPKEGTRLNPATTPIKGSQVEEDVKDLNLKPQRTTAS